MVLLGVWREDFTKKSPDHLFQVIRWSGAVLTLCSPKKLHNNIMPFFEYILSIFQVLLPDQPERSETNIKSKQPIYLPTILISGHKNAPVRRTWKMDKS